MKKLFFSTVLCITCLLSLIGIHNTTKQKHDALKVAILDTAAYLDHPDIIHAIAGGYNFVTNTPLTPTFSPNHFHGTHIAGIIAAKGYVRGVYPDAQLLYYVVDSPSETAYQSHITRGIYRAIQEGASIINFSGRLPYDLSNPKILQAIAYARANDVIFVKSCGNAGPDLFSIHDLATSDDVLAIGAYDTTTQSLYQPSSRGPAFGSLQIKPDFVAPGVSILSTAPLEDGRYLRATGTSMAAAYTSGALALVSQQRPELTNNLVAAALANNAQPLVDTSMTPYSVLSQGSGAINIDATLATDAIFIPHHLAFLVDTPYTATRRVQHLTCVNTTDKSLTYTLFYYKERASNAYDIILPHFVTLQPYETRSIPIYLTTTDAIEPGHYTGRIYLNSKDSLKNIPVLLEIPSSDFPIMRGLSLSRPIVSFKQTPDFHLLFEVSIPSKLTLHATSLATAAPYVLFEDKPLEPGIHQLFWTGETIDNTPLPDGLYELTGHFNQYALSDTFDDLMLLIDQTPPVFQEISTHTNRERYRIDMKLTDLLLTNSHVLDMLYRDFEVVPPAVTVAYSLNGSDYTALTSTTNPHLFSFSVPLTSHVLYIRATDFAGNMQTERITL